MSISEVNRAIQRGLEGPEVQKPEEVFLGQLVEMNGATLDVNSLVAQAFLAFDDTSRD